MITGQSVLGRRHSISVPSPAEMRAFVQSLSSPGHPPVSGTLEFFPESDPWLFDSEIQSSPAKRRRSVCYTEGSHAANGPDTYSAIRRGSTPTISPQVFPTNPPPPNFPQDCRHPIRGRPRNVNVPHVRDYTRQIAQYERTYSHLPQLDPAEIYPPVPSPTHLPVPSDAPPVGFHSSSGSVPVDNVNYVSPSRTSPCEESPAAPEDFEEFLEYVCQFEGYEEQGETTIPEIAVADPTDMSNFPLARSAWDIPPQPPMKVQPLGLPKKEKKLKWSNVTDAVTSKYQNPM